jgi:hypothetical protein
VYRDGDRMRLLLFRRRKIALKQTQGKVDPELTVSAPRRGKDKAELLLIGDEEDTLPPLDQMNATFLETLRPGH